MDNLKKGNVIMYMEDTKYIIKLIDKLSKWCKFFKKSHNIIRWNDIENEMRTKLLEISNRQVSDNQ